jgi:hypothetical protein
MPGRCPPTLLPPQSGRICCGRVEQPNEYLSNTGPQALRAIDDLLLTQGWRRVTGTPATDLLGGVSLMGRVLNAKNQAMPGTQVVVASTATKVAFVRSAGADEQGRFRLAGLDIADTVKLMVQLSDRQLKNLSPKEAHVVIEGPGLVWDKDTIPVVPDWVSLRAQLAAARTRQESNADLYRDKTVKLLKEVVVKARKLDDRPDGVRRASLHSSADATVLFDDKSPRFANLYEMIRGRLAGVNVLQVGEGYKVVVRGFSSIQGGTGPMFLMDGTPIDTTSILTFNPGDIERVELLKNAGSAGVYGVRAGNGVIAFYTKRFRNEQAAAGKKEGSSTMSLIGYASVQREFYVPRYELKSDDESAADAARIDRRDVLYWKPIIQTDSQGRSQLIVPLSDVVRTIRVRVQGVTAEGRAVVGEGLFSVQ